MLEYLVSTAFALDSAGHLLTLWSSTLPTGDPAIRRPSPTSGLSWDRMHVCQPQYPGGTCHPVDVMVSDRNLEAAILRITERVTTDPLALSSRRVHAGSTVQAYGFPECGDRNDPDQESGTVHRVMRIPRYRDTRAVGMYVLRVRGGHGYCGAPVLDSDRRVVAYYCAGGLVLEPPQPSIAIDIREVWPFMEHAGIPMNVRDERGSR